MFTPGSPEVGNKGHCVLGKMADDSSMPDGKRCSTTRVHVFVRPMELASLYHLLCLTAALLGLALILYAWRYRGQRDVNAFIGMMGCAGIWAALSPLIYLSPDADTAHLIYDLQFASTAFVPVFTFLFVLRYTRRDGWLNLGWIALMLVIPILTQVVIWGARGLRPVPRDAVVLAPGRVHGRG